MNWKEVDIATSSEGADLVANVLFECGSEGVSIYDSNDLMELIKSDIIWDYIDEHLLVKSEVVHVKGFYAQEGFDKTYTAILEGLSNLKSLSGFNLGSLEITCREISDEDWINVWRKYYQPIHIGHIVIVPNWLSYDKQPDETVVYMDPGMAFGTGEHESTKICLQLFSELDCVGKTVLDVGTGSGILGITAAVSGASKVYMSDIDEIAVKAAKENAAANRTEAVTVIVQDDLISNADIQADIVFANITADILISLSKDIGTCLRDGGYVILSGIIKKRYIEVEQAYIKAGYKVDKCIEMGEWCGIRLVK